MRIATWNVNSVNRRVDHITTWLRTTSPDVLCLQETKCRPADFPSQTFAGAGYESVACGNGAWNGVSILSRVGIRNVQEGLADAPEWGGSVEPRALGATCAGLRIWSLYVPNGRSLDSPHFAYKLAWLASLRDTAGIELRDHRRLAMVGDYNVAPTDRDVYDPEARVGHTHVSPQEREALSRLSEAGLREVVPRPLKYDRAFTFWDYRQLAFPKNHGMRIDLAFVSDDLSRLVEDAYVDRDARKGKGTSDHAPVVIDFDLSVAVDAATT